MNDLDDDEQWPDVLSALNKGQHLKRDTSSGRFMIGTDGPWPCLASLSAGRTLLLESNGILDRLKPDVYGLADLDAGSRNDQTRTRAVLAVLMTVLLCFVAWTIWHR
jgi:hypothetical protein